MSDHDLIPRLEKAIDEMRAIGSCPRWFIRRLEYDLELAMLREARAKGVKNGKP